MQSVEVEDRGATAGSVSLKLPWLKVQHGSAMLRGKLAEVSAFTEWLLLCVTLFQFISDNGFWFYKVF